MSDPDEGATSEQSHEGAGQDRPLDPEKLLRIASLAREVLEECRKMDPDEHTAAELAALHNRVTAQLYEALPQHLIDELEAIDIDLPFHDGPTAPEVRIAYSGLIGWLGGLFQGLQAAMQVQALSQFGEVRKELESGKEDKETPGRYL